MCIKKGIEAPTSTPLNKNTNLKAALGYARLLGWSVFPLHSIINDKCTCNNHKCENKGKHPATVNGLNDATTDDEKITRYWTDRPYLNIGVATGKKSGFFVVDIDNKIDKKTGINGIESFEKIERENGKLPNTVEQITGSGGSHLLFKHQEGIRNRGNIFPSIDVRGDGGYIVVSPSIHASNNKYQWELSSHPIDMDMAEAPKWLIEAINPPVNKKYKPRPVTDYISILQGVYDGQRNDSLIVLIGHLLARNIDYREAFEIVHMWNETRVNPPLESEVVTTAFNNILRRELEKR